MQVCIEEGGLPSLGVIFALIKNLPEVCPGMTNSVELCFMTLLTCYDLIDLNLSDEISAMHYI